MIATFNPCSLHGTIEAPPSKSMAHRYLIGAALSGKKCTLRGVDFSEDILASIDCLTALGTKITIEKGYRNNINIIGANIRSGYSDDFITLFNSFKDGGFPYQKETREVVDALKDLDAIKQDKQTMNLLLSKEKMLIDAEENRNQYYVLSAGHYVDAIINKATRFKFVPALYVETAISNADMYAEAKRVMEADLDKDAILDEIEEDEEREAKNAGKDPYEDR